MKPLSNSRERISIPRKAHVTRNYSLRETIFASGIPRRANLRERVLLFFGVFLKIQNSILKIL